MKLGSYEFQVLVNDKPMPEMVDPSTNNIYLVAEAGVDYSLKFLNHSEETVHISYSIDGKSSFYKYACTKSITIEGQKDGATLRPFLFALSPLSTPSSLALLPVTSPGSPGTISFSVWNSVRVDPFEVNSNSEVPEAHKFAPPSSSGQKIASLGTALGAPRADTLERKTAELGCGTLILANITFFVRSPLEMAASKLLVPCWKNWWTNERKQYDLDLDEITWEPPSFSCGVGSCPLRDLDLKSSVSTVVPWRKWGLKVHPAPKSLLDIFLLSAIPTHCHVEKYIKYFRGKLNYHISRNSYETWYDRSENVGKFYSDWVKEKTLVNQPKIILQAFADVFGIPLHIYRATAGHGDSPFTVYEVRPEKGRKIWACGYAMVYDNKQWFSVERCDIDLTGSEDEETRARLEKEMEEHQNVAERKSKQAAEHQNEIERKRKLIAEIDQRKKIKTEEQQSNDANFLAFL